MPVTYNDIQLISKNGPVCGGCGGSALGCPCGSAWSQMFVILWPRVKKQFLLGRDLCGKISSVKEQDKSPKHILGFCFDMAYVGPHSGTSGKEPTCQCRRYKTRGFDPWVRKILWNREWQPTPVFLPGNSHGQRSLVGHSSWGCKELDMIESSYYAQWLCHILSHCWPK